MVSVAFTRDDKNSKPENPIGLSLSFLGVVVGVLSLWVGNAPEPGVLHPDIQQTVSVFCALGRSPLPGVVNVLPWSGVYLSRCVSFLDGLLFIRRLGFLLSILSYGTFSSSPGG
jgi:hypothetical protein